MSNDLHSSHLPMPQPLRLIMHNPQFASIQRSSGNQANNISRNLYHPMNLDNSPTNSFNFMVGNPYIPQQPIMPTDISYYSPMELYNLECAKRLEVEQLANRRRHLECLQSYRSFQHKYADEISTTSPTSVNYTPPSIEITTSPATSDNMEPPFISTTGVNDPMHRPVISPHSIAVSDEYINVDALSSASTSSRVSDGSYYRYSDSMSPPPSTMNMPPLTRIIDDEHSVLTENSDKNSDSNSKKTKKIRCTICGENAICKSYGAVCCDSCRLFFRRTIVKEAHKSYTCSAKRKCIVTGRHRSRCQFCRFQRCLSNGMKPEHVLKNGNEKNVTSQDLIKAPSSTTPPSPDTNYLAIPKYNESLSSNEAFELHGVVLYYEKMRGSKTPAPFSDVDAVLNSFKDILSSFLVMNLFTPKSGMDKDVVMSIQNESLTGALMLRMAYHYDPVVHGLPHCSIFSPDTLNNSENKQRIIPLSLYDDILKTLKSIHLLKVDNTIICLLILVYISQTDNSFEFYMSGGDDIIDKFTILLKKYISSVHGPLKASDIFPKLLLKLTDIKELQLRFDKYIMPSPLQ